MYEADKMSTTAVTCGPKLHKSQVNIYEISFNREILLDPLTRYSTSILRTGQYNLCSCML